MNSYNHTGQDGRSVPFGSPVQVVDKENNISHKHSVPFVFILAVAFVSAAPGAGKSPSRKYEFLSKTIRSFLPVLKRIGSDATGDYIQVCYHILFSEIIAQLIKTGALPPIPESVPEHFGVFITIGSIFE